MVGWVIVRRIYSSAISHGAILSFKYWRVQEIFFCKYDLAIKQSILYWSSCFDFNIQSIRVILLKSLISKKLWMQLTIARMPKMSLKSPKCSPSKIVGDSTPVLKFENNQNDFLCFFPRLCFLLFFCFLLSPDRVFYLIE